MRRLVAVLALGCGLVVTPGAASAQGVDVCADPSTLDPLSQRFDEAVASLEASGKLDAATVDVLLGADTDGSALLAAVDTACAAEAATGGSSSLTGPCMGVAVSYDKDGTAIDAAADFDDPGAPIDLLDDDGGQAFTSSNPFTVDVDGYVLYSGFAGADGAGPTNHTWSVDVQGLEIDSGGDDNADRENTSAGDVDLAGDNPIKLNGLAKISGSMVADDGFECIGSGYFKTQGGMPIGLVVGLVLFLLGLFALLVSARPTSAGTKEVTP